MFQRRRTRVLLALLVTAAIALVTIDFRSGEGSPLERVRGGATAVLRPVQDGVDRLLRPFTDGAGAVRDLVAIRAENQELRDRVEVLEERRRVVEDLERENQELRDLLAIADRTQLQTVTARVVALAPSNFEWTVTIDVGSDDGVERGMPVLDGDGLVGRVIQVTPAASRVLLTIDPSFSAAARSATSGEVGVVGGRGGDPLVFRLLDPLATVEVGEPIVTSSFQGGVFPAGIPIGTVTAVGDLASPLVQEVQVSPYVDFTRLHHVLIVFSTGIDTIPPFEGSDGIDFVRPPVPPLLEDDGNDPDPDGPDPDGPDPDDPDPDDPDPDPDPDDPDPDPDPDAADSGDGAPAEESDDGQGP